MIPTISTSRQVLHHHYPSVDKKITSTGFKITLKHVDSGKNLTSFERLMRGIKRGRNRLHKLSAMVLGVNTDTSPVAQVPLHAGKGEFLMQLSIGTPPEDFSAILDTGSDLIWTQCKPCQNCFNQSTPIFDPKQSSSFSKFSCSSQLCEALPQSTCDDGCEYFYSYGDYSSTQGILASETFTFQDSGKQVSVPGIGFGCGYDNDGGGFSQGAGLVGLGRGPLSLVSQLKESMFSYCLTSINDLKTSSLLIGYSLADMNISSNTEKKITTTPLMKNPSQPSFYYLQLEGISVGDTRLSIEKDTFAMKDDGSGGLIIDSGTTISYLEESAFKKIRKEFISQMKLPLDNSGGEGLNLCFTLPSDIKQIEVPKLVLHLKDADLELPGENYMIADSTLNVLCLVIGSSSGMSILGNFQQQNMLVLHDLNQETLSFVPTQCHEL